MQKVFGSPLVLLRGALFLGTAAITSCKAKDVQKQVDDMAQICLEEPLQPTLSLSSSLCDGNKLPTTPALMAHFLDSTLEDEICLSDVISNREGQVFCAPGPLEHERKNISQQQEEAKLWVFRATPDYLVWHLDGKSTVDERFYLTNQSGFPLRSQVIKLSNQSSSTLVMFIKTDLSPETKYYLYLTTESALGQKTWIQPILVKPTE